MQGAQYGRGRGADRVAARAVQAGFAFARRGSLLALAAAVLACGSPGSEPEAVALLEEPPSVRGQLHLSAWGEPGSAPSGTHRTSWVAGPGYAGMEDNDLRGFLDGRFMYGWNQPGQIHVRTGRRPTTPRYGETELFRSIQRWSGIVLPEGARVHSATLRIAIEKGTDFPVSLMLYAVNQDWDPGRGGTAHDNTSPPEPGEVWWGERAHGQAAWGLPGLGFASDDAPGADTPAMPLAEVRIEPDTKTAEFSSPALASYVAERATRRRPILFLVKLSDSAEDRPDSLLHLYSANQGDARNPVRRPHLEVEWEAPGALLALERDFHLEHGRRLVTPRAVVPGAALWAVSFAAEPGFEAPTLEIRGGSGERTSDWRDARHPLEADWSWAQLRVTAARSPVELGSPFVSELRDTWVRTAPPEEQVVEWTFTSPKGEETRVLADYAGDYRWTVEWTPAELGRWRYAWTERFVKRPYESAEGVFDVVALDRENIRRQLAALAERIRREDPDANDKNPSSLAPTFWKLERAALALETPESFASPAGRELFDLLTDVREALAHRKVPDEAPLKPMEREF